MNEDLDVRRLALEQPIPERLLRDLRRAPLVDEVTLGPGDGERPPLSRRQAEVLELVADGLTNRQVAEVLGISVETVKTHLRWAHIQLGSRTRTQAVAIALTRGLIRYRDRGR